MGRPRFRRRETTCRSSCANLRLRKERIVRAEQVLLLEFVDPANDDLRQIVAEREKVGVDRLGELRLRPDPAPAGRAAATWSSRRGAARARPARDRACRSAWRKRSRRGCGVRSRSPTGMAAITARTCSRLGKSRNLAAFAVARSLFEGLKYSMSGTWIFDLKPGCQASHRKNSLSAASVLGLGRPAQRFAAPLAIGFRQPLLEADGLLAAKGLEVAVAGVVLEARERLTHRVERRFALAKSVLLVAQEVALDALILRVQFRHRAWPFQSHSSQWDRRSQLISPKPSTAVRSRQRNSGDQRDELSCASRSRRRSKSPSVSRSFQCAATTSTRLPHGLRGARHRKQKNSPGAHFCRRAS